LRKLHERGVSIDELRRAVEEDRLTLLPAERVLASDGEYVDSEVAEHAGIAVDFLRDHYRALGLPWPESGQRVFDDDDVEAAKRLRLLLDAGLDQEGVLEVTRVIG